MWYFFCLYWLSFVFKMRQALPPSSPSCFFLSLQFMAYGSRNQMEAKVFILPRTTKTTETEDSICHILVLFLHFPNHQTNSKAQIFQIESTNMNNHKATRSAQNLIETPRSKPEKQHHGHRKHHHGSKCLPSKAWPLAIKPGALIWCACSIKSIVWSIPSQPSHGKCHQVGSNHCSLCIPHPCSYFPAQSNPKTKLGKISKRELATYL